MSDFYIFFLLFQYPSIARFGYIFKTLLFLPSLSAMLKPTDLFIALGTFNLPQISGNADECSYPLIPSYTSSRNDEFIEGICNLCLTQFKTIVNFQNKILDLIFINMLDISVSRTSPFDPPEEVYHPTTSLLLDITTRKLVADDFKIRRYLFNKADFFLINNGWWNGIVYTKESNLQCVLSEFYDLKNEVVSIFVPFTFAKLCNTCPIRFSDELRRIRKKRKGLKKVGAQLVFPIILVRQNVFRSSF